MRRWFQVAGVAPASGPNERVVEKPAPRKPAEPRPHGAPPCRRTALRDSFGRIDGRVATRRGLESSGARSIRTSAHHRLAERHSREPPRMRRPRARHCTSSTTLIARSCSSTSPHGRARSIASRVGSGLSVPRGRHARRVTRTAGSKPARHGSWIERSRALASSRRVLRMSEHARRATRDAQTPYDCLRRACVLDLGEAMSL